MTEQQILTTGEVAERLNVSRRQLQWWDERGIVTPRSKGHKRNYTRRNVTELMLIVELRKRRFSMQQVRQLFRNFHYIVNLASEARNAVYIVAAADYLDLFHSPDRALAAIANQDRPVAVIRLDPEVRQ